MEIIIAIGGIIAGGVLVFFWRAIIIAQLNERTRNLESQIVENNASAEKRLQDQRVHFEDLMGSEQTAHEQRSNERDAVSKQRLEEQKRHYEELLTAERTTREKIQNEFKAAAAETLQQSAEQFLTTAIRDLRQVKTETDDSVAKQKQEITSSVEDMKARLSEYHERVKKFEEERGSIYAKLDVQILQILNTGQELKSETTALRSALTTSSAVAGRWGEMVLRNILTSSGLVAGIDFEEQAFTAGQEGAGLKPDVFIKLPPGQHKLVIDSKSYLLEKFLQAQEISDAEQREGVHEEFAKDVRKRVRDLSTKEYQKYVDPQIPYVVMFIPSEAAIRAAFSIDLELFQDAAKERVIIASPVTLIPLIVLIAHAWQQQKLAENARELGTAVEELGDRIATFVTHLHGIYGGLKKAGESWDKAVGSWQRSVLPQMDRTRQLGGKLKEVEEFETVPTELRQLPESTDGI